MEGQHRQVSEEGLTVILIAKLGYQVAQAAFLQLFVDIFHFCIVIGQHSHRLSAQQDIGEDVEDGLGLAGSRWAFDHADLRAERTLDGLVLAFVQPERINEPLTWGDRAVVPGAIGLQGSAGDGWQFSKLSHDIAGYVTISLRLRLSVSGTRNLHEITEDRRVLERGCSDEDDAIHPVDIRPAGARIVHYGISLAVDHRFVDRFDDRAARFG